MSKVFDFSMESSGKMSICDEDSNIPTTKRFKLLNHVNCFMLFRNKIQRVSYNKFRASQTNYIVFVTIQVLITIFSFVANIFMVINYPSIPSSVSLWFGVTVPIIIGWSLIILNFIVKHTAQPKNIQKTINKIIPYLQMWWIIFVTITFNLYEIAVAYNGQCDRDRHNNGVGCNHSSARQMPDGIVLISMILPIIWYVLIEGIKFEYVIFCYMLNLIVNAVTIGVLDLTLSLPSFLVFIPFTVLLMYEIQRQSVSMFLFREKVDVLLKENKLIYEKEGADEMRAMIGNVAHDLKTPLTAFTSGLEIMVGITQDIEQQLLCHNNYNNSADVNCHTDSGYTQSNSTERVDSSLAQTLPIMSNNAAVSASSPTGLPRKLVLVPLQVIDKTNPSSNPSSSHVQQTEKQQQNNDMVSTQLITAMFESIQSIKNINLFMLATINRCIDFTKASNNMKLKPHKETVSLSDAIDMPLRCCRDIQDKIKIVLQPIPKDVCNFVITDKQWLQENILCLLSNAVKYSSQGTVTIQISFLSARQQSTNKAPAAAPQSQPTPATTERITDIEQAVANSSTSLQTVAQQLQEPQEQSERQQQHKQQMQDGEEGEGEYTNKCEYFFAKSSTAQLKVEIEDNGIGISPIDKHKLFKQFKQAQRLAGGTGLGLYSLAKRMEALEGNYGVFDRTDGRQGSIFWFSVPYVPDNKMAEKSHNRHNSLPSDVISRLVRQSSYNIRNQSLSLDAGNIVRQQSLRGQELLNCGISVKPPISGGGGSQMGLNCGVSGMGILARPPRVLNILIVDDAPTIVKMSRRLLEREGHTITTATNGQEALDCIAEHKVANNKPFDVVLMDLQMPVMDGLEATRRLRQIEEPTPPPSSQPLSQSHPVPLQSIEPHLNHSLRSMFLGNSPSGSICSVSVGPSGSPHKQRKESYDICEVSSGTGIGTGNGVGSNRPSFNDDCKVTYIRRKSTHPMNAFNVSSNNLLNSVQETAMDGGTNNNSGGDGNGNGANSNTSSPNRVSNPNGSGTGNGGVVSSPRGSGNIGPPPPSNGTRITNSPALMHGLFTKQFSTRGRLSSGDGLIAMNTMNRNSNSTNNSGTQQLQRQLSLTQRARLSSIDQQLLSNNNSGSTQPQQQQLQRQLSVNRRLSNNSPSTPGVVHNNSDNNTTTGNRSLHFPLVQTKSQRANLKIRENDEIKSALMCSIVIGVSANSDSETIEEAFKAGVDAFIPKPFTLQSFNDTYSNLIELKEEEAELLLQQSQKYSGKSAL